MGKNRTNFCYHIRNQNINIDLDPLLILFLINDLEIVDDCRKIIKQLENYDKDIFNENCTLYSKLKNLCKIKNSEWNKKFKNVRNNLKELNKIDENDSNINYDKQIELLNDRKIVTNMSEVTPIIEKKIDENYIGFDEEQPKINDISDYKTDDEINSELNDKINKFNNNKNKFIEDNPNKQYEVPKPKKSDIKTKRSNPDKFKLHQN